MKEIFQDYIDEIIKYNDQLALVSRNDLDHLWERHFLDSIDLTNYLLNKEAKIIDLGSGAGFPGLILSYLHYKNVFLCEKNYKKAAFLSYMALKCDTPPIVLDHDIRDINDNFDILISRAFGSIRKILTYFTKCREYVLMKGISYQDEINEAKKYFSFEYQVVNRQNGVLLFLTLN